MSVCSCPGQPWNSITPVPPRCAVHEQPQMDRLVEVEIREGIERYLNSRRADPEFQRRLRARIEQDRTILDRLVVDDS